MRNNGKRYSPVDGSGAVVEPVGHPDSGIKNDESIEAKWEQIRYYESNGWQQEPSSLASSSTTSSSSGSSSRSTGSDGDADGGRPPRSKLQRMKQTSLNKLSSIRTQLANLTSGKLRSTHTQTAMGDVYGVSTTPDGAVRTQGVIPRIRASKSMQNLEQITRDGYQNLREMSTNLKEKYNSRLELRQAQPSTGYDELWDEDDDRRHEDLRKLDHTRRVLARVGF